MSKIEEIKGENNKEIIENRPLFSIIIPCYNSKVENIRELLQSIINGGCNNKLEIIIADGRSTDKTYLDEVNNFIEQTNINTKIITMPDKNDEGVDLINCPGNTREYGVRVATGQQITFIDHDDTFMGKVFENVKITIEETNSKYMVCSNFLQIDPIKNIVIKEVNYATNQMHGKFYNLDNLQKAEDLHFKTNLFSNEDIFISNRLHCILHKLKKLEIPQIKDFCYVQKMWPDSTSHIKYSDNLSYMEYFFFDYITATYDVSVNEYNKLLEEKKILSEDDIKFYTRIQTDGLLYQYFYLQTFKYNNKNQSKEHEERVKQNIKEYYERYNINAEFLYNLACEELIDDDIRDGGIYSKIQYNGVRCSVIDSCGNFIETDSFIDFISNV